jgi:hypothetical protein
MATSRFERILEFDDGIAMVGIHKTTSTSAGCHIDADKLFNAGGELC